jgi:uracil-DNA glycosylase family 4
MANSKEFLAFRQQLKAVLSEEFGVENIRPFWGEQTAKIIHLSQAPSLSVLETGRPFDDISGEILRNQWYQISEETFYDPENFYFTDIGMTFPGKNPSGGDHRPDFTLAERWLKKELSFLNPELCLVVGGVAAEFFFPQQKLTDLVFADQEINQTLTYVLPHPSPINIKWLKDHPEFMENRLPKIKAEIHSVLAL